MRSLKRRQSAKASLTVIGIEANTQRAEVIGSTRDLLQVEIQLYVSEDLIYFLGHFPGFPILPGVVQLDWAVHYAREFLELCAPVISVERLKFTCPIRPATQVTLGLETTIDKRHANFRFYHEHLTFSQGRLVYA